MKELPDECVEKFLRFYWEIMNLDEIHDDIEVEEFVRRCFKGYIEMIEVSDNRVYINSFGLFSEEYEKLSNFLRENGLTMEIGNPKSYSMIYLSIKKRNEK